MRQLVKTFLLVLATIAITPLLVGWLVESRLLGADRALHSATQWLALVPGTLGVYLRRAFLRLVLDECHASVTVEFGVLLSKAGTRLAENVYIGPYSQIGLATIGRDTLIASGVQILSGPQTHGIDDLERPIREQPGRVERVTIGPNVWLGANVVVMADVERDTVVAAGAVVNKPLPAAVIAAGVPAKVIRSRRAVSAYAEAG